MMVNHGVRPLGALAAGALATTIGTRETLVLAAAGGCLGVLWLVRSPLLRMRDLPEPESAAGEPPESEPSGGGAAPQEPAGAGAEAA